MLAFVHSGGRDSTWRAIRREADRHEFRFAYTHFPRPAHQRHDNERYRTLAEARNELLRSVQAVEADLFLSLDSDIMPEDPETIERLERLIVEDGFDLAQPVTFLHPQAPPTWSPAQLPCWAYNAGWFPPGRELDGCKRPWTRPAVENIPWGSRVEIDIPMACWLGNRRTIDCRYRWHESGEDIGFAQDLERAGLRCVWDTGLYARHIWADVDLRREEIEAQLP